MTLICHWCGGMEAPFHMLNVRQYGVDKYICEKCYKDLERMQKMEDLQWVT